MTFDAAIRNQITDLVTQTIEILLREQVALPNVIEMRVPHMPPSVLCYSLYETDENVTTIIGLNPSQPPIMFDGTVKILHA